MALSFQNKFCGCNNLSGDTASRLHEQICTMRFTNLSSSDNSKDFRVSTQPSPQAFDAVLPSQLINMAAHYPIYLCVYLYLHISSPYQGCKDTTIFQKSYSLCLTVVDSANSRFFRFQFEMTALVTHFYVQALFLIFLPSLYFKLVFYYIFRIHEHPHSRMQLSLQGLFFHFILIYIFSFRSYKPRVIYHFYVYLYLRKSVNVKNDSSVFCDSNQFSTAKAFLGFVRLVVYHIILSHTDYTYS